MTGLLLIIEAPIARETKGFRNRIETIVQIIFTNWEANACLSVICICNLGILFISAQHICTAIPRKSLSFVAKNLSDNRPASTYLYRRWEPPDLQLLCCRPPPFNPSLSSISRDYDVWDTLGLKFSGTMPNIRREETHIISNTLYTLPPRQLFRALILCAALYSPWSPGGNWSDLICSRRVHLYWLSPAFRPIFILNDGKAIFTWTLGNHADFVWWPFPSCVHNQSNVIHQLL